MDNTMAVTMTALFEEKFVQGLSSSLLHKRLSEAEQGNVGKVSAVSVAFMEALTERVRKYKPATIDDFRCFESDGILIGALYDKAFLAYPENFGNQSIVIDGSDTIYELDGKSFGLISSMLVCRELSRDSEKKGDWTAVLDLLEAYFAIHDACLSAGRLIDLLPDAMGTAEIMEAYSFDLAFRTMLRLKGNDGVSATYDRLVKAKDIVSKPTLLMRLRSLLRVA